MSITPITSLAHFQSLTSSSTYVVADFYADWCGPCKQIAPIYAQLAATHSSPGRIVFVKVDVDAQQDVAKLYGVSAMPTFLILKNTSVTTTLRGANPSALRTAVAAAASDAASGPAKARAAFTTQGRALGGDSGGAVPKVQARPLLGDPRASGALVRFVALYFTTLFSLDAGSAAAVSPFAVGGGRR